MITRGRIPIRPRNFDCSCRTRPAGDAARQIRGLHADPTSSTHDETFAAVEFCARLLMPNQMPALIMVPPETQALRKKLLGRYENRTWLRPAGTMTPRSAEFTRKIGAGSSPTRARQPLFQRSASTTRPGVSILAAM